MSTYMYIKDNEYTHTDNKNDNIYKKNYHVQSTLNVIKVHWNEKIKIKKNQNFCLNSCQIVNFQNWVIINNIVITYQGYL